MHIIQDASEKGTATKTATSEKQLEVLYEGAVCILRILWNSVNLCRNGKDWNNENDFCKSATSNASITPCIYMNTMHMQQRHWPNSTRGSIGHLRGSWSWGPTRGRTCSLSSERSIRKPVWFVYLHHQRAVSNNILLAASEA